MLVALGWTEHRIAATIGISYPTLRKHYFYELRQRATARDMFEARRFEIAWEQYEAGNIAASRVVERLLERNDRMEAERSFGSTKPDAADAKPVIDGGKKVTDRIRAMEADEELDAQLDLEAQGHVSVN